MTSERVRHNASGSEGTLISRQRRYATDGVWILWSYSPRPHWSPAAAVQVLGDGLSVDMRGPIDPAVVNAMREKIRRTEDRRERPADATDHD